MSVRKEVPSAPPPPVEVMYTTMTPIQVTAEPIEVQPRVTGYPQAIPHTTTNRVTIPQPSYPPRNHPRSAPAALTGTTINIPIQSHQPSSVNSGREYHRANTPVTNKYRWWSYAMCGVIIFAIAISLRSPEIVAFMILVSIVICCFCS